MDIDKKIGSELDLRFIATAGKITLQITHDTKGLDTTISIALDPEYFISKLSEAFPKTGPFLAPVLRLVLSAT